MRLSDLCLAERYDIDAPADADKQELSRVLKAVHTRPWGDESFGNAARWQFKLRRVHRGYSETIYAFDVLPLISGDERTNEFGSVRHYYKEPQQTTTIDGRPDSVYRGMSWEEWLMTRKSGVVQSRGSHNFDDQQGLTFFGSAETAEYYASSFAPIAFKATPNRPGVVLEVPRQLVYDHTDDGRIPAGEFATESIPLSQVTRKWKLLPTCVKPGRLEVIVDRNEIREGSRMSPSVAHVAKEF